MYQFIDDYENQRLQAWPYIETFFSNLPDPLTSMGWQFVQQLSYQTALPSGSFKNALKHPAAARVTYLPLWYIDAYLKQGIDIPNVEDLQSHLFASAFLGFCAIRIHDDLVDEDKPDTPVNYLLLANLLTIEAIRHLQLLFDSNSPFWSHHIRHWREYTHAVQVDKTRDQTGLAPFDHIDLMHIGRKAALLKTYPVAVAIYVNRDDQIVSIESMMDAFNTAIQINNDIQSIHSDIKSGHYTHPITSAALNSGHAIGTHPTQDVLVRSLALSSAVVDAHKRADEFYISALKQSNDFGIKDLSLFIKWHIKDLEKSKAHWRGLYVEKEKIPASFLSLLDAIPASNTQKFDLSRHLERALAYLEFDPLHREAWEIQRTGIWENELLIGDVFSRALVVETLAQQGRSKTGQVEEVLRQYRENGWRYYRDFKALPPDIDDIAQAIRLVHYADWDKETKRDYLKTPLRWLRDNRIQDGSFPVWLTEAIEDEPVESWIPLGGEHCLACEANLIYALSKVDRSAVIDSEQDELETWIDEAIYSLLDRWEQQSYSGIYYYKPTYGAAIISRCFRSQTDNPRLKTAVKGRIWASLHALAGEHRKPMATDTISLATSAYINSIVLGPTDPVGGELLPVLLDGQSFDGGWDFVELFRCPSANQQDIGWHGSRMLTTAYVVSTLSMLGSNTRS